MDSRKKVICIGSPVLDRVINVPEAAIGFVGGKKGGMELVDEHTLNHLLKALPDAATRQPGGSAGNTAFALAKLGMRCRFLGMVGADEAGEYYQNAFAALGGDTRAFKVNPGLPTAQCLSIVTPDGERTMRTHLGAAMGLKPSHIDPADFRGCVHAHIEGYLLFDPELPAAVLKAAKQSGCRTSLDLASFEVVNSARKTLPALLDQYVDMVFANEEEAQAFAESTDPAVCLAELTRYCPTVALKQGERGALLSSNGQTLEVPAVAVDRVLDTTGAGDFWAAGFLFGDLTGKDLRTAGAYGARLGAAVVQEMGAVIAEKQWMALITQIC